ncbi:MULTISPECIES: 16S rRNA (cytidine(1402)-2'-O)-methyltransferase [unclassified Sporolactobacillus]|uniref:16S rRNA (cytidine(1402)-2'-O)-methyltransferase n=1 Tax=unclassified Sporolactobacillus TaxID=2628533 RepID=UPI002368C781|nr:16S rRNA (cytidine(1402)-2'-O)-methyltransferase [Sporolactobacillus sp. CQH2019]MDD9150680.1 16S rRNA (cytidine(1402)-2'-O)-methyltransferase [Sporolactobacillus sp. CQH2019]
MWEQKSFQTENNGTGTLYLVPTPIGNLNDMTFRALDVLKKADILAAEDTRQTMKLCTHFDIHVPLVSYHEHNKKTSGKKLIGELEAGKNVALVTDAGTPGISDPGSDLAAECIGRRVPVVPLPGANAAVTGLIASGLPTDHFLFYGFLPRTKKEREQALEDLSVLPFTLIFYESPFRVRETIKDLNAAFGKRRISLSRELTKRYETFVRGDIGEAADFLDRGETLKGEVCLVVEGSSAKQEASEALWWAAMDLNAHVDYYVNTRHLTVKEAIKQTAVDRSLPKREVYRIYHHIEE